MELEKAVSRQRELEDLVDKLTSQLNAKNYKEVYAENELMKRELKSMHILMDENNDLKQDLERLRKMPYDERVAKVGEENARLRHRNGELLV